MDLAEETWSEVSLGSSGMAIAIVENQRYLLLRSSQSVFGQCKVYPNLTLIVIIRTKWSMLANVDVSYRAISEDVWPVGSLTIL